MSYEAPFETTGAPDGEYSESHSSPSISEAWTAYDSESRTPAARAEGQSGAREHLQEGLMQTTQEQLNKLGNQVKAQWQQEQWPSPTALLRGAADWLQSSDAKMGADKMSHSETKTFNTEEIKRWSALVGGGFLALAGLRRSFGSLAVMGFGAGLAYYALTGRSPLARFEQGFSGKQSQSGSFLDSNGPITVKNIIVKAPLHDVYEAWADFEKFPRFMEHIRSVAKTGEQSSRWLMEGPFHMRLEWNAETTRLEPNKRIAWSSTEGDIKTSGQVTFNALPDGQVEVTVMLKYVPPAGIAGDLFARLFNDPQGMLESDLRNFKRYIEGQTRSGDQPQNGKSAGDTGSKNSNGKITEDKTATYKVKGTPNPTAEAKAPMPS